MPADTRVYVSDVLKNGVNIRTGHLTKQPGGGYQGDIEHWSFVALYGILEELKKLNAVFACHNAQDIPNILRRIEKAVAPRFKCCGATVAGKYHKVGCRHRKQKVKA